MLPSLHIVYHHAPSTGGGTAITDYGPATWSLCGDFVALQRATGDRREYYMRPAPAMPAAQLLDITL
jgi:hypothetical protein